VDFIKRILESFLNKKDEEIFSFIHDMDEDSSERIITVHATQDGYVVFSIFTIEQWSMVTDICELTDRDIEEVVCEISEDENIPTISIDPKDFFS